MAAEKSIISLKVLLLEARKEARLAKADTLKAKTEAAQAQKQV